MVMSMIKENVFIKCSRQIYENPYYEYIDMPISIHLQNKNKIQTHCAFYFKGVGLTK